MMWNRGNRTVARVALGVILGGLVLAGLGRAWLEERAEAKREAVKQEQLEAMLAVAETANAVGRGTESFMEREIREAYERAEAHDRALARGEILTVTPLGGESVESEPASDETTAEEPEISVSDRLRWLQ